MKITSLVLIENALTDVLQPLILEMQKMSQQIADLHTATAANTTAVQALAANAQTLKSKLDAALAANADLTAQLATAQANQTNPADIAAIVADTTTLVATTQLATDTTATTNPAA